MCCCFYGSVFCHFPAWQLLSMGALSPRRRRVVQICRQFIVCWPQCSSTGLFCGLRYNPIRFQRLFLHTFSDKPEKVCPRSDGYSVAVKNGTSGANRKRSGLLSAPKLSPPPRRSRDFSAAVRRPANTPRPDGRIPAPAGTIQDSTRQARRGHTARRPSWTAR